MYDGCCPNGYIPTTLTLSPNYRYCAIPRGWIITQASRAWLLSTIYFAATNVGKGRGRGNGREGGREGTAGEV